MTDTDDASRGTDDPVEPAGEDVDPGSPLPELAELSATTSPDFEARVQNRIQRRLIAGDVVKAPADILVALLEAYLTELFKSATTVPANGDKPPIKPNSHPK